ncbi:MAG TPA: multiheme c-type cytochrome [Acidobacteriaceae bacterium]|nr:multiheme c-type cytochrome [Acidobacteriaceae bacterium]
MTNARRWGTLLACGGLVAGLGLLCAAATPQQASEPATPRHAPPPASAYAGDAACAECHAKEARTYEETAHAHDSSVADRKTILGDFTPGKNALPTAQPNVILAMIDAPDGFYQSAVNISDPQNLSGEAQRFDIVIGSGRRGQTYLYWKGNQLFELPVSYWSPTHEWVMSPGYNDGMPHFDRPVPPRCMECHASYFEAPAPSGSDASAAPLNAYRKDNLVLGIGCERCHGPGAEHVAREKSAHPPAAGSAQIAIVNPARLSRDRSLDVCGVCHAGAGPPIGPSLAFQPGDVLANYVKATVPAEGAPVDVHGNQVSALERSKCFTSGKLTCATRHNVHEKQQDAAAFSAKCLTCHEPRACPKFRTMGAAIRTQCIGCHMPEGQSQLITGERSDVMLRAQLRTHRIAIYPAAAATVQ